MAMTKAEMKAASDQYKALFWEARQAEKAGQWQTSIDFAVRSLPHIDGMMQYERKYEQREFDGIGTIDIILKRAPLLMDASSLKQLETLLIAQKRIDKHASDDLAADLQRAIVLLWDAYRLWNHIEAQSGTMENELAKILGGNQATWRAIVEAWEACGVLKCTPERGSYRLDFYTKMDEHVSAKCGSCGVIVSGPKSKLLEPRACPKCAVRVEFVILTRRPADLPKD